MDVKSCLLLLSSVCSVMFAQSSITLEPTPVSRVAIAAVNVNDPQQKSSIDKIPAEFRPILKYCYFIRNDFEETIVSYSTRWTRSSTSTVPQSFDATWWDLDTLRGGDTIAPGELRLVTPIYGLGVRDADISVTIQEQVKRFLLDHDSAKAVKVSLDSIILEDGRAFGPDRGQAVAGAQAHIDVRKHLSRGLLERLARGDSREQVDSWLSSMVDESSSVRADDLASYWGSYHSSRKTVATFWRQWVKSAPLADLRSGLEKYLRDHKLDRITLQGGNE
jgi:hypothetical protein